MRCIQHITKVLRKASFHFPKCFGCEMLANAEGAYTQTSYSAVAAAYIAFDKWIKNYVLIRKLEITIWHYPEIKLQKNPAHD